MLMSSEWLSLLRLSWYTCMGSAGPWLDAGVVATAGAPLTTLATIAGATDVCGAATDVATGT